MPFGPLSVPCLLSKWYLGIQPVCIHCSMVRRPDVVYYPCSPLLNACALLFMILHEFCCLRLSVSDLPVKDVDFA